MLEQLTPARVISPGRIIKRELDVRGWTQKDLATIMDRPEQTISEIIRGKKQITPETAHELSQAFSTSPDLWMNLESNYRLALTKHAKKKIARRSHLYSIAPVAELKKRGWIDPGTTVEDLEEAVCKFLNIDSPNEPVPKMVNLRHSQERSPDLSSMIAWVKRVENLSNEQEVAKFDPERLKAEIHAILSYSYMEEDVRRIPYHLFDLGIHFLIIPHLPRTYIDGAQLFIGDNPAIALTLRCDRIDAFWYTLLHEIAHIVLGHHDLHLDNLFDKNSDINIQGQEANNLAADWLIDQNTLNDFVESARPHFSRKKIIDFSNRIERHPAIVLGRLQYDEVVEYNHLRSLLVKVRPFFKYWIDVPNPRH